MPMLTRDPRGLVVLALVLGLPAACAGLADASGEDGGDGASGGGAPERPGSGTGGVGGGSNISVESPSAASGPTGGGTDDGPDNLGGSGPAGDAGGGGVGGSAPDACEDHLDVWPSIASVVVDDSSSYASPLLVRELVFDPLRQRGAHLPVRPHEFLNYYADRLVGGPVDHVEGGLHLGADAQMRLGDAAAPGASLAEILVTVSAEPELGDARPDVTFLLDTSISMGGEGTARLQGVVLGAVAALAPEQSVAVLTSNVLEPPVRAMAPWDDDVSPILDAADRLTPDADFASSLRAALQVATVQAEDTARPGVVLVISDGSIGLPTELLDEVALARDQATPVRVVGVGVGPGRGYADDVFDELTDRSGGAYWYAPDRATAEMEVAARFDELTRIAARDVSLELHLPEGVSLAALSGGAGEQGGTFVAEGQNLGVGGTMAFHLVLAIDGPLAPCVGVGVRVRRRGTDGDAVVPAEPLVLRLDQALLPGEVQHGAQLHRASAVAAAAEALRGERSAARLERAAERLRAALSPAGDAGDPLLGLCGQIAAICAETDGAACVGCSPF